MTKTVYICAADENLAARLGTHLESTGVQVRLFSALQRMLEWMEDELPDAVVLQAAFDVPEDELKRLFTTVPTVVVGEQLFLPQRWHWFQLGAHDVVSIHYHGENAISPLVSNVLFRLWELSDLRHQNLTTGNLEIFSLFEIFETAFKEEKSLIIKISYQDWSTTVRMGMGHLLSVTPAHPEEHPLETLLKVFLLPGGSFITRKFEMTQPEQSVFPSVVGVLAEARYWQRQFQELTKRWEEKNPAVEINESALKQYTPTALQERLLATLREYPLLSEALIHTPGNYLQLLTAAQQLYDKKIITPVGRTPAEKETLATEDVQFLRQHIFPENVTFGKLVVLGLPSSGKSELIRTFAGLNQAPLKQVQSLDFTRIRLDDTLQLALFGVSIEENFQPILEKLSEGVLAMIFLVDFQKPERFEYTKYLIHSLMNTYDVFFVVGVSNAGEQAEAAVQQVREALEVPEKINVLAINPVEFGEVRRLLYQLQRLPRQVTEEGEA